MKKLQVNCAQIMWAKQRQRMMFVTIWMALVLSSAYAGPSILFCTPKGSAQGSVDLPWLSELHDQGLEPDFLANHQEFTWDRVRQYNCLVVYGCPAANEKKAWGFPEQGPRLPEYIAVIERFLEAGGGVFMMVHTDNADHYVKPLLDHWGARLPFESYHESDATKIAEMPRMQGVLLSLIDNISPSPVTDGVRQLWLPYGLRYNTSWTAPIAVEKPWQVVVHGSKTSRSRPIDVKESGYGIPPPPHALVRPDGVASPAMAAIREYKKGRLFLMCQAPVFTIGQGTQWLYNRRSLSKGLKDVPSDFGTLATNAFRWLSEPSLSSQAVGGYKAEKKRFSPPNHQPHVKKEFERAFWSEEEMDRHRSKPGSPIFRGLIGAQTSLSGGQGTVADYAVAAQSAGLDFVVFTETFATMTEADLRALDDECRKQSSDELLLLPGYTIDTNIGNHMFFCGPDLPWPRDDCLTGSNKDQLMIQYQDENGAFVKGPNTYLQWVLYGHERYKGQMVGVYNFDDPRALQVTDLKLTSAVAVKTYIDGELVDEQTDGYLLSAAGTLPNVPVAVSLVRSPKALVAQAKTGRGLTYAQARTLQSVHTEALRWNSQYDGMNVFASEGPIIRAWPQCYRAHTYGAEGFTANYELMRADLHVTSDAGLAEIKVMNADRMIRRFLPKGAKEFRELLHLAGHIQQNLIVLAKDVNGREAVSFARRSWKSGSLGISFCGDHVNDCGRQYLARGTGTFVTHRFPKFPAGFTWDGGPKGVRAVLRLGSNHHLLDSSEGEEGGREFNNIPILEFSDDQAVVVRSLSDEVYDPKIPAINAWYTSGPKDPAQLSKSLRRYVEFNRPLLGPIPTGWAAQSVRSGAVVANFSNLVTFKREQTVNRLTLLHSNWIPSIPAILTVPSGKAHRSYYLGDGGTGFELSIDTGKWFGFYTKETHNQVLFVNRGDPIVLKISSNPKSFQVRVLADTAGRKVKAGDQFRFELFSVNEPLDVPETGPLRFNRVLSYLRAPDGLQLVRGTRQKGGEFFDVQVSDRQPAEIRLPKPETPIGLTLPVRVSGLNPKWSAGLYQISGHSTGHYTDGNNVYTTLGFDFDDRVYAALYPDQSPETHVVIGHPVVCDNEALVLEVMPHEDADGQYQWRAAVNNPTNQDITAVFSTGMKLPGLTLPTQEHTIPAGGYVVLNAK